jgi:hypothetical protein
MRRRQREPSADPRDALIAAQAERIAAQEALVADLDSRNSSMPPSTDDQPGGSCRVSSGRPRNGRTRSGTGEAAGQPRRGDAVEDPGPDRGPLPAGASTRSWQSSTAWPIPVAAEPANLQVPRDRLMGDLPRVTFEAAHRLTCVPPSHKCSACTVTPSGQRSM